MKRAARGADTLLISPAGVTHGNTATANLDTKGYSYATIRVALSNIVTTGVASADGVTVRLAESDVTHATSFATVVADRSGIKFGREIRYDVDLKGRKRYLRTSVIPGTSGVTNEPVTACAFGTLHVREDVVTASSQLVAGTNDAVVNV